MYTPDAVQGYRLREGARSENGTQALRGRGSEDGFRCGEGKWKRVCTSVIMFVGRPTLRSKEGDVWDKKGYDAERVIRM